jgi:hypothetical protein
MMDEHHLGDEGDKKEKKMKGSICVRKKNENFLLFFLKKK